MTKGRDFAYCRTSTIEQSTDNQVQEIRRRGYQVEDNRIVEEKISGGVNAMQRPLFKKLVEDKMEKGDRLIVLKLDRLGRDAIDVLGTIQQLQSQGIRVMSLDLPEMDLTKPEGKMMLQIFAAFAEFEKGRIKERTMEGLAKARSKGRVGGRPPATKRISQVQECKADGLTQAQVAAKLGVNISTVKRHWNQGK